MQATAFEESQTEARQNPNARDSARAIRLLVTSVCIISTCGLVYELLISTLSSYFLGSSVLHFSLTIGLFMSFMGVGSYLSKFI